MAFDDVTRARLQKFVGEVRAILSDEFTRQLQQDFGLDPKSGTVAEIASLARLDDRNLETARILREILDHYAATNATLGPQTRKEALERIAREQAFTFLNRLAALRLMEARGILIESVAKGYQSQGFQLYQRVANGSLGETGDTYRSFLLSLFDHFADDLPALFDRFAPEGLLFPREAALLQVLAFVNHGDLETLWVEDETIGWIYQYFNSKEERRAMRDASQAPRNSRELAVRNQFFTPRYVVEFLVDNTLGRLWFNWTGGETWLRDRCQYLLAKPDEKPTPATRLRDPRTIRLIDPACGSMHFGLYAFNLFLDIYREAWGWEQAHGPGSLNNEIDSGADLKPLCQTYPDQEAFARDVPRLIIERNIYGVDVDPRAAQIAALALWLRAQRAWHDAGVKAGNRPQVGRGNVVAAVAPPAEVELRQSFMKGLDRLDAELFERTLVMLKGLPELGMLLQVEKELPRLVREVYGAHGPMFEAEDRAQWEKAETRLRVALTEFAEAAQSTYQGRLFAQDALQGLRIIDLASEVFDVAVMNPPFGALATETKDQVAKAYPRSKNDLLAVFVERGLELLRACGRIGAITSRTCFFLKSFEKWRKEVVLELAPPVVVADLGLGVMDDAMVEAAAYVLEISKQTRVDTKAIFFRLADFPNKQIALFDSLHGYSDCRFEAAPLSFSEIPGVPFAYWVPEGIVSLFSKHPAAESSGRRFTKGLCTTDDFRFVRLWWESCAHKSSENERKWFDFVNGSKSKRFFFDPYLSLNWRGNGSELKSYLDHKIGRPNQWSRWINSVEFYFKPGVTWPLRSSRYSPQVLPRGVVFSIRSYAGFTDANHALAMIGIISSEIFDYLFKVSLGRFGYPEFVIGVIQKLPFPEIPQGDLESLERLVRRAWALQRVPETCHAFVLPRTLLNGSLINTEEIESNLAVLQAELDDISYRLYGLSDSNREKVTGWEKHVSADSGFSEGHITDGAVDEVPGDDDGSDETNEVEDADALLSWAVGVAFGRFDLRLATGERAAPPEPDPFDPLPAKSPGMLPDGDAPFHAHPGFLVDDPGHPRDLARLMEDVLARVDCPPPEDVRRWLQRDFFPFHLQRYSKSRRKAPVYWPLSTASGGYTLWVYYPNLTSQTLYTAINDFLEPKLADLGCQAAALRAKGDARSRDETKALEALQEQEQELIELRDALLLIAPAYKPDHDDGVQITAAPLWPLFRHKPWQKLLKETWTKLERGDYDWAHLAMAYWPDRVRQKCKTDKSLAIAHDLEHLYVEPTVDSKKKQRKQNVEGNA
jgi:hypothetical protein